MKQLTVKDLVDILKDYDVVHVPFHVPDTGRQYLGSADDYEKRISINTDSNSQERREAVLHELYHIAHFIRGDLDGKSEKEIEVVVDKEAGRHYARMYNKIK